MIKSLANIIAHFPSAANRARCTAHIINLVSKIILCQFDARKKAKPQKKSENANNDANEEPTNSMEVDEEERSFTALAEGLDREEQEVADDKSEDEDLSENIGADLEEIEEAMKDNILEVAKKVKPIQRVLFKVCFYAVLLFSLLELLHC